MVILTAISALRTEGVDEVFALDLMRANPLNPAYNSDGTIAMPDNTTLSYTGRCKERIR